jgi:hypothetical protein
LDELTLEPYAVEQTWHLPHAVGYWESILGEYLQQIAEECTSSGNSVVGHIKALATFSENKYLRISVVAANIPANVEGNVPSHCTELELTLNVLIYGLERRSIETIAHKTANKIATYWKGTVYQKNINQAGGHLHHQNNHEKYKGETQ